MKETDAMKTTDSQPKFKRKKPKHWTANRVRQANLLTKLLRDCESLNSGSHVIERMKRIVAAAHALTSTNWKKAEPSFDQFLTTIINEDLFKPS